MPELVWALTDPDPLVRGHAAWALGRVGTHHARQALAAVATREEDEWARSEVADALAAAPG